MIGICCSSKTWVYVSTSLRRNPLKTAHELQTKKRSSTRARVRAANMGYSGHEPKSDRVSSRRFQPEMLTDNEFSFFPNQVSDPVLALASLTGMRLFA